MADIAAGDVTYTITEQRHMPGRGYRNYVTVAFGNGALTYPSGGVPLTKGSMGCPNVVREIFIEDEASATGLVHKIDKSNLKIRSYEGDYAQAGDAGLVELDAASDAPAAQTIKLVVEGY